MSPVLEDAASGRPDRPRGSFWILRFPVAFAAAGLTAGLLAIYAPVVFGGKTFVLRDALRFTLPSREFLGRSLSHGHVPEWWDGVGFGVAFAANPVHGVASPMTWLMALSPSAAGSDVLTVLQLAVLAIGAALLARRLGASLAGACFSGAVLATSGYVASAVPNGNVPCLMWIPWVLWAALLASERREGTSARSRHLGGSAFAAALALQLLSGEPGHVLVAVFLVVIGIWASGDTTRRLGSLMLPAAAGLGLAAAGALPAILHISTSARAQGPAPGILKWSMHPGRLLEWVWPLPFGSEGSESWFIGPALRLPAGDPAFALSLFLGLPTLVLGLVAARELRVRRLLVASSLFVVLALGSFTPVYSLVRTVLPPLRLVNFPEKFVFGAVLLWCAAAGVGLSRIPQRERNEAWAIWVSAGGAVILAFAAGGVHFARSDLHAWLASRGSAGNVEAGLSICIAGAAVAAAGSAMFGTALVIAKRRPHGALALTFVGVLGPLLFAERAVTPLADRTIVDATPRAIARLPRTPLAQNDVRPRLFLYPQLHVRPPLSSGDEIASDIQETLDTNVAARFGYDVVPGFETGDSRRFRLFWESVSPRMSLLGFVRFLGVDFAVVPDPERLAPGFPVFERLPGWGVVGTFPVRPRAFVAPRATAAASADEGLRSLSWPNRESDPARVVVSGAGAEGLEGRGPLEPCGVRSPHPEEVWLECRSTNGGYAVLLDEHLPGWSAEVDGEDAPILTADGLFRAVRVSGGEHRIGLRYRTPGLRAGAWLSMLTLAALVAVVVRSTTRTDVS